MRLDFNILWVEDQQTAVAAQKTKIERILRNEGFRLQVIFASSVDEAKQALGTDIYGDHVDLVLMDFELGDGPNGGEGISAIRERFPYKDIIFYSASEAKKLKEVLVAGDSQGVFCSPRDSLTDTVKGVFEVLVKKVVDIDHSRGIVMGATSEIDHLVNLALFAFFEQSDAPTKAEIARFIDEHLEEIQSRHEEGIKALKGIQDLSTLENHHQLYTSSHRLRLLRKLLASRETSENLESMKKYGTDAVPMRNTLAHVLVERDGFSRKLFDKKGQEITADHMRQLRLDLLAYHATFEVVMSSIGGKTKSNKGEK